MKILIIGGDGFCGWPLSLHLSLIGYNVTILDDLSRRNIDVELGTQSLTPIQTVATRLGTFQRKTGKCIRFINMTVGNNYELLKSHLSAEMPEIIVDLGKQRAAPYSMKNFSTRRYTVQRNISSTHDLLAAISELKLKTHLVHLGTMGVYGYDKIEGKIPEGYLDIEICDSKQRLKILSPTYPGSIYHMTKSLEQIMFQFYAKNDMMKISDLHQGIVWGTQTDETKMDNDLINRFDYDGEFGTVINRFLVQSCFNLPLSVYGSGGQTRAFIHITDMVQSIKMAIDTPPREGNVKIVNQMTEVHTIKNLAELIANMTNNDINFIYNPREECEGNKLSVNNQTLLQGGLKPITLSEGLLQEMNETIQKYKYRCKPENFTSRSYWNQKRSQNRGI